VSLTLEIPIFWVPWVIAFSCGAAALVLLHNLLRPRQEIV